MKKIVTITVSIFLLICLLCGCTENAVPSASVNPTATQTANGSDPQPTQTATDVQNTQDPQETQPTQDTTVSGETDTTVPEFSPTVEVSTVTPTDTQVTPTPTPSVANDVIIESFDSGNANSLVLNTDWSKYPAYRLGVSNISITNNSVDSGKGLLVTMPYDNSAVQNLTLTGSKITDAFPNARKYLRMWVSNNSSTKLAISIVIKSGTKISNLGITNARLTDVDGNPVSYDTGDPSGSGEGTANAVYVPVGFSGWLAFDTTEAFINHWVKANKNQNVTNIKSVDQIMIDVRAYGLSAGDTYVLDQLCLTNKASKVAASTTPGIDTTPTPVPATSWEGKYLSFNGAKSNITVNAVSKNTTEEFPTFSFTGEATLTFDSPVSANFNYYSLRYKSTQPLWMYIQYTRNGSAYEELCFLDATSAFSVFNSYIDGIMDNASQVGTKITGFRFLNRGSSSATVVVSAITSKQNSALQSNVYLVNDYMKIGADLVYGGALSYLEYVKEPVAMVTMNGRAEIGIDYASKVSSSAVRNTNVNLLNNYDTGRLVQQSFYGTNGANDDYEMGTFMGYDWLYNPVMGGDRGNNHSKIVDFKVTSDYIYVKSRPMDWGKLNSPTYSYMESTYTLNKNNVIVQNRFVDYSNYKHIATNQELPAFYVVEPLYRLVHYEGNSPWTNAATSVQDDLPFWNGIWPEFKSTENWWAWTNGDTEKPFGLGLYVPGVTKVTGGISDHNGTIKNDPAKSAPTSYIAPLRTMAIKNYKPIEYSYAIVCGTLTQIRASVYEMKTNKTINNNSLLNY